MNYPQLKPLNVICVVSMMAFSLGACASDYTNRKPIDSMVEEGKLLPFMIVFDQTGKPILVDERGETIAPIEENYPIKTTAIERIDSITIVQYRGSHVFRYIQNGITSEILLPHNQ